MRDLYGKAIDPMLVLHSVIDGMPGQEETSQNSEEKDSDQNGTSKLEPGIYKVACEAAFVRSWDKLIREKQVYRGETVYVFGDQKWLDKLPFYFIGAGYAMAAYDSDGTVILEKVKDGEEE